jgi:hypothetical protein
MAGFCLDCGSPRLADLDAPAGIWVCDDCGLVQPLGALPPTPPFADEPPHGRAETVAPCPRYL